MSAGGAVDGIGAGEVWRPLADIRLPTRPGTDRLAADLVGCVVRCARLAHARREQLQTAVGEAVLNALEHGNTYTSELPVLLEVLVSDGALAVRVTDYGSSGPFAPRIAPDLDAKLAGDQAPGGWGFFLIEQMVDVVRVSADAAHHTVELLLYFDQDAPA